MLAKQLNVRAYEPADEMNPVTRAEGALALAKNSGFDTLIVDTAGRLHIDDELMQELAAIRAAVEPQDLLYVADAMTGQDAVKSAGEFHRQMSVTGVVLTKTDGDARGGAALSMRAITQKPIKFLGEGERMDALQAFDAARIAGRILDMGDIVSLVEKASETIELEQAKKTAEKMAKGKFDLVDYLSQLRQMQSLGVQRDVVLVYVASEAAELAFRDELQATGVRAVVFTRDEPADLAENWTWAQGVRLDAAGLERVVPDIAARHAFISGPPRLIADLAPALQKARSLTTDAFAGY